MEEECRRERPEATSGGSAHATERCRFGGQRWPTFVGQAVPLIADGGLLLNIRARIIVATPGSVLPRAGERQGYLLMVLPKLKASMRSSMKRTNASSMALLRGLGLGIVSRQQRLPIPPNGHEPEISR